MMDFPMPDNLQDKFLNKLRKDKVQVSIFLVNGIKLDGIIDAFDPYTILLKNKVTQSIYKHDLTQADLGYYQPH